MPKKFKYRVSVGIRGALVGAFLVLAACGGGGGGGAAAGRAAAPMASVETPKERAVSDI